jgi:hypothetical protein
MPILPGSPGSVHKLLSGNGTCNLSTSLEPPWFASPLDAALWWVKLVPVVPLAPKFSNGPHPLLRWKEDGPLRTVEEVREFWGANAGSQLAVVLGPMTGGRFLGAVDTDLKNRMDGMPEPPAGYTTGYRHSTKNGGTHDLFVYTTEPPESVTRRTIGVGGFVDVLLDGLLVVPPTRFDGAGEYRVVRAGPILEFPAVGLALDAAAPWLRQAWNDHRPKSAVAGRPDNKEPILEGNRRATLLSRAGKLRDFGVGSDALIADLREYNERRCSPPLPDPELVGLARDVAKRYEPTREPEPVGDDSPVPKGTPAADVLVEIARSKADLFRDGQDETYATVTRPDGRLETYRLRSKGFRSWLGREYYLRRGKAAPSEAMSTARATIEAFAAFDGQLRSVALRVGSVDGCMFIDLGDDTRRAVRVSASGWEIVNDTPVRFVRGPGMAALPNPERGGSLLELLPFLNAKDPSEPHFVLSVAFVLGTFHPSGPYAILAMNGERGSGKSHATVRLKALTDPSSPPHRAAPKEARDLAVASRSSWVLALDNLSGIPDWLSDAICRLSTGGGFATRSLYTDDEETLFSGKRPVLFNGIVPVASAADLRDRCLLVTWPTMKSVRTERELDPAFDAAAPRIFGAVLDSLVSALARHGSVAAEYVGRLPRMGDFFAWVLAAEPSLPWPPGTFERVFAESRETGSEIAVSESTVALALQAFLKSRSPSAAPFEGTASTLLAEIAGFATPPIQPGSKAPEGWPKSPSGFSGVLRRMAPDLRVVGVWVEFPEGSRKRGRLFRVGLGAADKGRESASPASPRPLPVEDWGDGVGDAPARIVVPPVVPTAHAPGVEAGDAGDGESRPLSGSPLREAPHRAVDQTGRVEGQGP